MGRRFNDEPINLICRIPSPKQLDEARPAKPTIGQMLTQKGAAFFRSAIDAFSFPPKAERQPDSQDSHGASHDQLNEERSCLAPESEYPPNQVSERNGQAHDQCMAAHSQSDDAAIAPPQFEPGVSPEEEIGELRTFLLRQQQDIVGLAAQIQELKAMVQSQQQVILCLMKESEVTPAPFTEERVVSAVTKGDTLIRIRQKPVVKEKAKAEKGNPTRASLNL